MQDVTQAIARLVQFFRPRTTRLSVSIRCVLVYAQKLGRVAIVAIVYNITRIDLSALTLPGSIIMLFFGFNYTGYSLAIYWSHSQCSSRCQSNCVHAYYRHNGIKTVRLPVRPISQSCVVAFLSFCPSKLRKMTSET